MSRTDRTGSGATRTCDVCVVGAGAAGLNALFVASRYLDRDQSIVLVDSRDRVGGMWTDTYPYVRLHQPHRMFTAGNIDWTLGADPSYLAAGPEVLGHLEHCLDTIEQRVQVDELLGTTMVSHTETDGVVRVVCASAGGTTETIEAKRLIKACGFRITPNDPLALSSTRLRSVSPNHCGDDVAAGTGPVWIIGGGKTGMDTALEVITRYPGREVHLVAGAGTFFHNRDLFFPTGARRWWTGELASHLLREVSRRFDGTNEAEVWAWHAGTYGNAVTPETGRFLVGVLSESETARISAGLRSVIMDYLVDAVDERDVTRLVFRSGETVVVPPDSVVVNCTGYVLRHDHPYEPYTSPSGAVLSVQPRSATLYLTTMISYFLTNLMFAGKLTDTPLYELDVPELQHKSPTAMPYTLFALSQYNISLLFDAVPYATFRDCGLDLDRWYPPHRRMLAATRFALTHRRDREHLRHTLDTVRERFDVRCGPLPA
ncbi:FAD-dependent oxidoreductase [Nocardia asteroides]|uniref:FAD-dependent oxidoreductase n=1 Tax=Nocardia asteroides TaxID=1824 RepID=UPI0037AF1D44